MSIVHYLVSGALKQGGSWGGPDCRAALSENIHILESFTWIVAILIGYHAFAVASTIKSIRNAAERHFKSHPRSALDLLISRFLAFVHFSMYGMLVYYKTNTVSLIQLIQPCHLVLLLEGIALTSEGPLGVQISVLILPTLVGCLLALMFPDTSGLFQYLESESYWWQHYLILTVPFYLLARDQFLGVRAATYKTVWAGLAVLAFLHFSLYEVSPYKAVVHLA
jgi:hypothetical protein